MRVRITGAAGSTGAGRRVAAGLALPVAAAWPVAVVGVLSAAPRVAADFGFGFAAGADDGAAVERLPLAPPVDLPGFVAAVAFFAGFFAAAGFAVAGAVLPGAAFFAGALLVLVFAVAFAAGLALVTAALLAVVFFFVVLAGAAFGVEAAAALLLLAGFAALALLALAGVAFFLTVGVCFAEVFFAARATSGTSPVRHENYVAAALFIGIFAGALREPGRNINHFPKPAQCCARAP